MSDQAVMIRDEICRLLAEIEHLRGRECIPPCGHLVEKRLHRIAELRRQLGGAA